MKREGDTALTREFPILEAVEITKGYGGRRHRVEALSQVSIAIEKGERLGVVGESGSGKSTLARLLMALESPDKGDVRFSGRSIVNKNQAELAEFRRAVQIVFQDPFGSLDPRLRVADSIAEPLRSLDVSGDHRKRVDELIDAVGLPLTSGRLYPHQFSGGQRQRIAIARALAPQPRVLIADEAVSALDVSVRAQVLNLIASLVERFGLTLVFISHDMAVVRHVCTRIVVLYRGQVVESGPVERVFNHPEHPYTVALLQAVPTLGGRIVPPAPSSDLGELSP
ncbi:MAG: ABC transporter ATP-binding protein [Ferrimicrobium sp.]